METMNKEISSRSGSSGEGLRNTSYECNVPLENASSIIKDKTIHAASDVSNEMSDSSIRNRKYVLNSYGKRGNDAKKDDPEISYCIIRSSNNYYSNLVGSFEGTTERDRFSKQRENETEYEENDIKKEDNCTEKNINSIHTNLHLVDNSASELYISKTDLVGRYLNSTISSPFNFDLPNKVFNHITRTREGPSIETLACRTPYQDIKSCTASTDVQTRYINNTSSDLEIIRTRITPRKMKRTCRQPRGRTFVIPNYTKKKSFMDFNPLPPRFISPRFACKPMRFFFNGPILSQAQSLGLKGKEVSGTCPTGKNVTEVSTNKNPSKTNWISKDSPKITDGENLLSLAAKLDEPEEKSSVCSKNEDMRTIKYNLSERTISDQRDNILEELIGWTLAVLAFSFIAGVYLILSPLFK